jgi:16S rRNA G527 N7-methylase RsmG
MIPLKINLTLGGLILYYVRLDYLSDWNSNCNLTSPFEIIEQMWQYIYY